MAREQNKKAGNAAEGATSKQSQSGKKTPKSLKPEPKIVKKSPNQSTKKNPEKANHVDKEKEKSKKESGNAAEGETSKPSQSEKRTQKPLKPEPKIVKKSPDRSTKKNPEKANHVDKARERSKKESGKSQAKDQRDAGNREKIDGMIFMCNAKTKSDCFHYMVMGLPQNKKHIVATIKPGMKLFLFDFDAKLLYGIYKAASAGGMKLKPSAFNGSYPAQVCFKVHMDCLPISEGTFRKAMMGNSGGDKIKFNIELTTQQVRKLTSLFKPSPVPKPNVSPTVHSPEQVQAPLIPLRPRLPANEAPLRAHASHPELPTRSQKEVAPVRKEAVPRDPLSFGEREYRMFGLRKHSLAAPALRLMPSVALEPSPDPYDPYTRGAYTSKMDSEIGHLPRRIDEHDYRRSAADQLATQPAYYHNYTYGLPRNEPEYGVRGAEASRLHSAHAANALSDYNRSYQSLDRSDYTSLPVSSRYSFGGPSFPCQ